MRKLSALILASVVATLILAGPASAEQREVRFRGFGPRVGVSFDPNQIVFGGHGDFGDPLPQTSLLFPVIEVGVGDNLTVVSVGTDLLVRTREQFGVWNPYAGGELALLLINPDGGDTQTELGLSGIIGISKGIGDSQQFATELKFEIIDAPNVKLTAIWTFGR